jgi:intracellular multiplication protein IcmM
MAQNYEKVNTQKGFYVRLYRSCVGFLLFSLLLNGLLLVGIFYEFSTRPEPDFYSTNGVTPPVILKAMLQPNYSSKALLKADPVITYVDKQLPS